MSSRLDRYRHLFAYERDSHAKVLASLEAVPEAARASEAYTKALTLLAHVAAARRLWLFRLGYAADAPKAFFPSGLKLADVRALVADMEGAWTDAFGALHEEELDRVFEYRSLEGERFRNVVDDILTQLFGHSLYHRGQIALLLRQMGAQPAETDYVFWAREPR